MAGCVSVRRQSIYVGYPTSPGCREAEVNGKAGNACVVCSLCPKGQRCWTGSDSGFLEKCPRR